MFQRITINPEICGGQACIKGTRVPVHLILDFLSAGNTIEEILKEYPQLVKQDVLEAIQYAAKLTREEIEPVLTKVK